MSNNPQNRTIDLVLQLTENGNRMYEWDLEREYFISNKTFKDHTAAIRYNKNPDKVQQILITSETMPGQYWHLDYNAAMNLFLKKNKDTDAFPILCVFFFTEEYKNSLVRTIISRIDGKIPANVMKEILDKLTMGIGFSFQEYPQLNKKSWKEIRHVLLENCLPVCQDIPKGEKRRDNHPWIIDTKCLLKNTYFPDFLRYHKENSYSFLYHFLSEYFGTEYQDSLKRTLKKYAMDNYLSFQVDKFVEDVINRLNQGETILLYDFPDRIKDSLSYQYSISQKTISEIKKMILQGENSYPLSALDHNTFWVRFQNSETEKTVNSCSLFQKSSKHTIRCAMILMKLQTSSGQYRSENDLFQDIKEIFNAESPKYDKKVHPSQVRTFQNCLQELIKEGLITQHKSPENSSSSTSYYTITSKSPIFLQKSYNEILDITHYMKLFQNNPMTPNSLNKLYTYLRLFISVADCECDESDDWFDKDRPMSIHLGKQPADSKEFQKVKKLFHDVNYKNYAIKIGIPIQKKPKEIRHEIVFPISLYYTDEKNQFYLLGIKNRKKHNRKPIFTLIPVNHMKSVQICKELPNTTDCIGLSDESSPIFHHPTYMKTYEEILSAGEPNSPETKIILRFPGLNKKPIQEKERYEKERTKRQLRMLCRSRKNATIHVSDDDWIYEDFVKDLSECNYYIRKFFDKFVIEEPEKLKTIQRKSAEKLLKRYGEV